jgi:V8-like Glu-specific endopeptidase
MERQMDQASASYDRAIEEFQAGEYARADNEFTQARLHLTNNEKPPNDYYKERYYTATTQIEATRAYVHFMQASSLYSTDETWRHHIDMADTIARDAIDELRGAVAQEVKIRERAAKFAQAGRIAFAALYGVTAALADSSQTQVNYFNARSAGASSYATSDYHTDNFYEWFALASSEGFFAKPDIHPIPLAIGGSADRHSVRIPVIPSDGIFRSFGRLVDVTNGTNCTSFIIDERIALTNAHCVAVDADLRWERETVSALPEEHEVVFWLTADGVNKKGYISSLIGGDWALLILAESASDLPALPIASGFDMQAYEENVTHAILAGYNGDTNGGYYLTMHFGCAINGKVNNGYYDGSSINGRDPSSVSEHLEQDFYRWRSGDASTGSMPLAARLDNVSLHSCDTYFGSSGAPLLVYSKVSQRYVVAGINQGVLLDHPTNGPFGGQQTAVSPEGFYESYELVKEKLAESR